MGENRQMGRHQAHSPLLNRRRVAADDLTRAPGFATAETEIFMGLLGHSREDLERCRAEGVI